MSFPNSTISDIVATTIELRSKDIADNVTAHNAFLRQVAKKGNVSTAAGGTEIREHFSFAENGNGGSYSGYDQLPTAAQDVISGAQYTWAQYAVPVTFSGREKAMNSGPQALMDLVKARVKVAETTMQNLLNRHAYLDGTGNNGKNLTGLAAAIPLANTSGTYGGIARSTNTFWQPKKFQATVDGTGAATSSTIQGYWNSLFLSCTRGTDKPSIILCAPNMYTMYQASLQPLQRFMSTESAGAGFQELSFMGVPVVFETLAAGITTSTAYFINTDFFKWRPHADRNMVALDDKQSTNQDATVKTLVWMGNMTCSGQQFSGIYSNT